MSASPQLPLRKKTKKKSRVIRGGQWIQWQPFLLHRYLSQSWLPRLLAVPGIATMTCVCQFTKAGAGNRFPTTRCGQEGEGEGEGEGCFLFCFLFSFSAFAISVSESRLGPQDQSNPEQRAGRGCILGRRPRHVSRRPCVSSLRLKKAPGFQHGRETSANVSTCLRCLESRLHLVAPLVQLTTTVWQLDRALWTCFIFLLWLY
ncbi:hypothetical protein LZ31DRAFT_42509 [Colletotrichum somersetense]|nr:hypothetical protein LZ31DRAFT_42509 [Colletotrichum somersetense]